MPIGASCVAWLKGPGLVLRINRRDPGPARSVPLNPAYNGGDRREHLPLVAHS